MRIGEPIVFLLIAGPRALASRTGWMLACHFVGRKVKSEKPLRSSSLSRPIDTARCAHFTPVAAKGSAPIASFAAAEVEVAPAIGEPGHAL
jgi:hypothetical protein